MKMLWIAILTLGIAQVPVMGQTGQPPVPVAQPGGGPPKVIQNKPDEPGAKSVTQKPLKEKEDGALLPPTFIKNRIEQMPVSVSGYVPFSSMKVDSKKQCWLDPQQNYGKKSPRHTLMIMKDDSGVHVVLDGIDHQWEAEDFDNTGWIQVQSFKLRE
jgi:hypothetical protein